MDFLFPPKCAICGAYIESRYSFCHKCMEKLLRPHRLPLRGELAQTFDGGIWVLGVYKEGLRDAVRKLKYQKRKDVLAGLQQFVGSGLAKLPLACEQDKEQFLFLPVPLHSQKFKERGFNQSELLFAKPFAAYGIKNSQALERVKATQPQFGLSVAERSENVRSAFVVRFKGEIADKHILLVDDIMTTGATMLACGIALKKAGAAQLTGIVLASDRK